MDIPDPWLPVAPGLALNATPIRVRIYEPEQTDPDRVWTTLLNVRVVSITDRIGTDPGTAILRYQFGTGDATAPQNFEEAISDASGKDNSIYPDDRIVIEAQDPAGEWHFIFDGLALNFGGELGSRREQANVTCIGTARMAWDEPIAGARWRGEYDVLSEQDYQTDATARFNPEGKGNRIPRVAQLTDEETDFAFPVFCSTGLKTGPTADEKAGLWELPEAVEYILNTANRDQATVKHPTTAQLDAELRARKTIEGTKYDPLDPTTYEESPIIVPDRIIDGKDWPGEVHALVGDKGYLTKFTIETNLDGDPEVHFRIDRVDMIDPKDIYLQPRGETISRATTNLWKGEFSRSMMEVVNSWEVEGDEEEYEASFILAAGFPTEPDDADTILKLKRFESNSPDFDQQWKKHYRLYILDEAGAGHYIPGENAEGPVPPDLKPIFGDDDPDTGLPSYVIRRRKPMTELITTGIDEKPLRASLSISTDYKITGAGAKPCPAVWDGSGTWQPVSHGSWSTLKDQIGIYINADNPERWNIGKATGTGYPFPMGVVKAVTAIAKDTPAYPRFALRYTCKIEGDHRVKGVADTLLDAFITRTIKRKIDRRKQYKKQIVTASSAVNTAFGGARTVVRDDTDKATAEAEAIQMVTQNGVLNGRMTIPYFTRYYEPGDRIKSINGRGLSFATNAGGTEAEPTYPIIIERMHMLDGVQRTILTISDADQTRHLYKGTITPKRDRNNT